MYDGLLGYEKGMLTLGMITGFVLLALVIYCVGRDKPYKALLGALVFPVVMIGFPSIQKIKFSGDVLELEKQVQAVEDNPTAPDSAEKLDRALEQVAAREGAAPQSATVFSRARAASKLAKIAESAKSQKEPPEKLKNNLTALQSSTGSVLNAEAYRKVAATIRATPVPPRPENPGAISEAESAYLAAMAAYNDRKDAQYDQAFSKPLECFYGDKAAAIESKRPSGKRTTTLHVLSSDLTNARQVAPDKVVFCDMGTYETPGAAQKKHQKLILMRRLGSAWLIAVEDSALNPRCTDVVGANPCN